ncbi:aminoglycoside phosphotransferase [Kutzneria kofuensis]|uniref:Maltokinase n=1 Tax=Kutzneria kofuensis TaxID=103725 RepID=A0A7W9NFV9_9PSEU|nr:aminoglycoside phosphotransferase [Kutzneria kofuensis]MBB5890934.1 maltokinase [Kutzneria kofuensis]
MHWDPESPGRMSPLEHALVSWLPRRRWFAGGGRDPHRVEIVSAAELTTDCAARGALVIVEVSYPDGDTELYQLPLGQRTVLPSDIGSAAIMAAADGVVYDATVDSGLMGSLLAMIGGAETSGSIGFCPEPGAWITGCEPIPGRPLAVEQSNTSVVFGDRAILKLFRRLAPGVNPELELHRAITGARVPRLLGAIEGTLRGAPITLGVLHEFAAGSRDGWLLATEAVRNLVSGVDDGSAFVADVELLGAAVADVHVALADRLGTSTMDAEVLADVLSDRLDRAIVAAPALARQADRIRAVYRAPGAAGEKVLTQRVHGDLHLGQVLRADDGWLLTDFEGEPAAEDRLAVHSPLRDVAGMLRSFDYAASQVGDAWSRYQLERWLSRVREAFGAGYGRESGVDLARARSVLTAYELDKAVYEVAYETRNRPSWAGIPLRAVAAILGG